MANRMGMYFAALLFGCGLGIWGCWISENDRETEKLYICAHSNMNERGMGVEEAYIHCSRERHPD